MAEEELSVSFATSSQIEEECFECDTQPRSDAPTRYYSEIIYDAHEQSEKGYYLPVTVATSIDWLPDDVALWLIELRHCVESTEISREAPLLVGAISDAGSWASDEHSLTDHTACPHEDYGNVNLFAANSVGDRVSSEPDELLEDPYELVDPGLNICDDFNEHTVISLDSKYEDVYNILQAGINSEHFQIWEGLQIPRRSLIGLPTTCTSNLNSDFNFEREASEYTSGMARSNSFWEANPLYSTGSLQNDGSVNEKSINDHGEWIPCTREFTKLDGEYRKHYDAQSKQEWSNLRQEEGREHRLSPCVDENEQNEAVNMEDVAAGTQVGQGDESETLGTVLNSGNNYNIHISQVSKEGTISLKTTSDCILKEKKLKKQPSALLLKCENILNNLDGMIEKFEDIKKVFLANDENIEDIHDVMFLEDSEFVDMCESAACIIEETLKCHTGHGTVEKQNLLGPLGSFDKLNERANPLESTSSEYDDVFNPPEDAAGSAQAQHGYAKPTVERTESFDINEIFDKGGGASGNRPVPPTRKKKGLVGQGKTSSCTEESGDGIIGRRHDAEFVQPVAETSCSHNAKGEVSFNLNKPTVSHLDDNVLVACTKDNRGEDRKNKIVSNSTEIIENTDKTVKESKKEPKIFRITNMKVDGSGATADDSCQKRSPELNIPQVPSNQSESRVINPTSQSMPGYNYKTPMGENQKLTVDENRSATTNEKQAEKQKPLTTEKPSAITNEKQADTQKLLTTEERSAITIERHEEKQKPLTAEKQSAITNEKKVEKQKPVMDEYRTTMTSQKPIEEKQKPMIYEQRFAIANENQKEEKQKLVTAEKWSIKTNEEQKEAKQTTLIAEKRFPVTNEEQKEEKQQQVNTKKWSAITNEEQEEEKQREEKQKPVIAVKWTATINKKQEVSSEIHKKPLEVKNRAFVHEKQKTFTHEKQKTLAVEKPKESNYVNWPRGIEGTKKEPQGYDSTESSTQFKIHLTQTTPISSSTFPNDDSPSRLTYSARQSSPENSSKFTGTKPSNLQRISTFQQISNSDLAMRTNSNKTNPKDFSARRSMPPIIPEKSQKGLNILMNSTQSYDLAATGAKSNKGDQDVYTPLDESNKPQPAAKPGGAVVSAASSPLSTRRQEEELLERTRKGSTASDVAAWKATLARTISYYHDDEMDPQSIPSNEWFSSNISGSLTETNKPAAIQVPDINIIPAATDRKTQSAQKRSVANITKLIETELRGKPTSQRDGKSKSLVLTANTGFGDDKNDSFLLNTINWPEFWDTNKTVLREGILSRTKLTENGKKVRKNWVTSYVVLTEPYLLIIKDVKTFHAMKISTETFLPEVCVDLNGAYVEIDEKLSSRKNVFMVSTIHGLQVLLQAPSSVLLNQWFESVYKAILAQPDHDTCPRIIRNKEGSPTLLAANVPEEKLKVKQLGRTRSIKVTNNESNEDLSASVEERQTKTRARLKKFFTKRPSKESLVKKGIYKDEPMFGCNLCDVVPEGGPCIPAFVLQCIRAIETKPENMKTDGLYRASGNLSQVQKIRLQVDQNKLAVLEEEEDVHVLTGVLKLFFRELKRPLIPFELFNRAIAASSIHNQRERVQKFRDLVRDLPPPNHDTLDYLLQHLLRVTQNKEHNRMHIPNIAIVFGPTLMRPEEESLNMALDLMKQNSVIECLLVDHKEIFA